MLSCPDSEPLHVVLRGCISRSIWDEAVLSTIELHNGIAIDAMLVKAYKCRIKPPLLNMVLQPNDLTHLPLPLS